MCAPPRQFVHPTGSAQEGQRCSRPREAMACARAIRECCHADALLSRTVDPVHADARGTAPLLPGPLEFRLQLHTGAAHPHTALRETSWPADAARTWQAGSLPVNSRQQLPLWLARSLHQRSHIQMDMPACYGTSYREALRSDPSHMNLRDHSEYYFAIGKELSTLCATDPADPPPVPAQRVPRAHMRGLDGAELQPCGIGAVMHRSTMSRCMHGAMHARCHAGLRTRS